MYEVGHGALSRTTRDDIGAEVEVCSRCGERESLYGYDPTAQPPMTEWPLSAEKLADEEYRVIVAAQSADMAVMMIEPGDEEDEES